MTCCGAISRQKPARHLMSHCTLSRQRWTQSVRLHPPPQTDQHVGNTFADSHRLGSNQCPQLRQMCWSKKFFASAQPSRFAAVLARKQKLFYFIVFLWLAHDVSACEPDPCRDADREPQHRSPSVHTPLMKSNRKALIVRPLDAAQ